MRHFFLLCLILLSFQKSDKVDIFSKYNDIGGRLSKEGQVQNGARPQIGRTVSADHVQKASFKQTNAGHSTLELSTPQFSILKSVKDNPKVEPNTTANVLAKDEDLSRSEVHPTQEVDNKNRLSVSRESKQPSSIGSAKSLQLDDASSSSTSSLPKIEVPVPRSSSRGSSASHSPLPPDFKLPAIQDGQSLVSPDYNNKKGFSFAETTTDVQVSDANSDISNIDTNVANEDSSTSDVGNTDKTDNVSVQEQKDQQFVIPDQEVVKEVVDNNDQSDSRGFELDNTISPVPTPTPVIDDIQVGVIEENLNTFRDMVYQGCLDREWRIPTRIIRVYISSTFLGK